MQTASAVLAVRSVQMRSNAAVFAASASTHYVRSAQPTPAAAADFAALFGGGGGGAPPAAAAALAGAAPPAWAERRMAKAAARAPARATDGAGAGAGAAPAAAAAAADEADGGFEGAAAAESVRATFAAARLNSPLRAAYAGGAGGGAAPSAADVADAVDALAAAPVEAAAAAGAGAGALDALLAELRAEPPDVEVAAKFALFEEYAATVSELRDGFCGAVDAHGARLPAGAAPALRAALARLDADGSAAPDAPPGTWFAHAMATVAARNHGALARLTADLETKLRLCDAPDAQCPICLADITAARPSKLLSCCHRVCEECFENWAQVCHAQHRAPFCPLCMAPAFLDVLAATARAQ